MCKRITLVGPVSSRADATSWSSFRRLDSSSFYSCPNRSGLLASAVLVALLIIIMSDEEEEDDEELSGEEPGLPGHGESKLIKSSLGFDGCLFASDSSDEDEDVFSFFFVLPSFLWSEGVLSVFFVPLAPLCLGVLLLPNKGMIPDG